MKASRRALSLLVTVATCALASGALMLGASCKATTAETGGSDATDIAADGDGGSDGACVPDPVSAHRTIDPSAYDHTCAIDGDCTMITAVTPEPVTGACYLDCCNPVGVRSSEAVTAARARLQKACCVYSTCTVGCPVVQVTCVTGQCVVSRPDAGVADSGDAATD